MSRAQVRNGEVKEEKEVEPAEVGWMDGEGELTGRLKDGEIDGGR